MQDSESIARREFLKTSVLAGSGIFAGSRLLTDGGHEVQAAAQPAAADTVAIRLRVNGTNYGLRVDPRTSLLDLLREKLDLPGTKKGCNHGQCGACTILVDGRRINSCLGPFAYTRAASQQAAIQAVAQDNTKFLAGGTNLIDLMKENVEQPSRLVDINRLELTRIVEREGGLRLGALAKNSDTANHRLVRERYPLVSQAILAGASPQLRNAATNGGNLMQRTRCYYFYDVTMPCNKRQPGSGCGALEGFSRIHAIFGASRQCIATHPSDMCVALAALEAVVNVEGPQGARTIPFADFHRLPDDTPQIDTNLKRDELITGIDLPAASSVFSSHSYYLKVRDRASYAFALVSVAAALDIRNGVIHQARLAMGGVAHKPWRATAAEQILNRQRAEESVFRRAAEAAMQGAEGTEHNRFKIELGKRALVRALTIAANGRSA